MPCPAHTEPNTRERQAAISNAKSGGDLFLKTCGLSLNTDDFFIAKEREERKGVIITMDMEKEERSNSLSIRKLLLQSSNHKRQTRTMTAPTSRT
jgi:hypothetical protein